MLRLLCRIVPPRLRAMPLLLLLLLVGCARSHGGSDSDSGTSACDCCGVEVAHEGSARDCPGICELYCTIDAGPSDAPPPLLCECCGVTVETTADIPCELGVCDPYCLAPPPPPDCPAAPVDLLCDYSHVSADEATSLPILLGGTDSCFCGETLSCRAERVGAFTLELTTGMCSHGPLCDGCYPYVEGACDLPALEEGRWTLQVNGQPAFVVDAVAGPVVPERGSVCQASAQRDSMCGLEWPSRGYEASRFCHPAGAYAGERVAIEVTDGCGGCGTGSGPCRVDVFDDVVRVTPSALAAACDVDCPGVCLDRQDTCVTPALEAGAWRLLVAGVESTLVVSDGDEPPPEGVLCHPATLPDSTP